MPVEELRGQFREAMDRQDWTAVLEIGERLHAAGDHGRPAGIYAHVMEHAAVVLGQRDEALHYSKAGLAVAEPGTAVEAGLLWNGTYTAWLCGQPNRALRLGKTYLERYASYPPEGQAVKARVIHHMAMAHELRKDFGRSIPAYRRALAEAEQSGPADLEAIILADLAVALLRQAAPGSADEAAEIYRRLDGVSLFGRARFAFLVGQAHLLHAQDDFAASKAVVDQALMQAVSVAEAMPVQRAELILLQARNSWRLGQPYEAMRNGLRAALIYQAVGVESDVQTCAAFLTMVSGQAG